MTSIFQLTYKGEKYDAFACKDFFVRNRAYTSPCDACHFPHGLKCGREVCEGSQWCCADINGKNISVFFRKHLRD